MRVNVPRGAGTCAGPEKLLLRLRDLLSLRGDVIDVIADVINVSVVDGGRGDFGVVKLDDRSIFLGCVVTDPSLDMARGDARGEPGGVLTDAVGTLGTLESLAMPLLFGAV